MPMIDNDELLARVDDWLENTPLVVHAGTVQMVERLAAALRAALAARPQPLFEGTLSELDDWRRPMRWNHDTISVVVYEAVAGSAIPTEIYDEAEHLREAAVGSAAPTQCRECDGRGHTWEFSRDGYMTCDWCGGSGEEPATPIGDDDE